jgi:hypothetical protein
MNRWALAEDGKSRSYRTNENGTMFLLDCCSSRRVCDCATITNWAEQSWLLDIEAQGGNYHLLCPSMGIMQMYLLLGTQIRYSEDFSIRVLTW